MPSGRGGERATGAQAPAAASLFPRRLAGVGFPRPFSRPSAATPPSRLRRVGAGARTRTPPSCIDRDARGESATCSTAEGIGSSAAGGIFEVCFGSGLDFGWFGDCVGW